MSWYFHMSPRSKVWLGLADWLRRTFRTSTCLPPRGAVLVRHRREAFRDHGDSQGSRIIWDAVNGGDCWADVGPQASAANFHVSQLHRMDPGPDLCGLWWLACEPRPLTWPHAKYTKVAWDSLTWVGRRDLERVPQEVLRKCQAPFGEANEEIAYHMPLVPAWGEDSNFTSPVCDHWTGLDLLRCLAWGESALCSVKGWRIDWLPLKTAWWMAYGRTYVKEGNEIPLQTPSEIGATQFHENLVWWLDQCGWGPEGDRSKRDDWHQGDLGVPEQEDRCFMSKGYWRERGPLLWLGGWMETAPGVHVERLVHRFVDSGTSRPLGKWGADTLQRHQVRVSRDPASDEDPSPWTLVGYSPRSQRSSLKAEYTRGEAWTDHGRPDDRDWQPPVSLVHSTQAWREINRLLYRLEALAAFWEDPTRLYRMEQLLPSEPELAGRMREEGAQLRVELELAYQRLSECKPWLEGQVVTTGRRFVPSWKVNATLRWLNEVLSRCYEVLGRLEEPTPRQEEQVEELPVDYSRWDAWREEALRRKARLKPFLGHPVARGKGRKRLYEPACTRWGRNFVPPEVSIGEDLAPMERYEDGTWVWHQMGEETSDPYLARAS